MPERDNWSARNGGGLTAQAMPSSQDVRTELHQKAVRAMQIGDSGRRELGTSGEIRRQLTRIWIEYFGKSMTVVWSSTPLSKKCVAMLLRGGVP